MGQVMRKMRRREARSMGRDVILAARYFEGPVMVRADAISALIRILDRMERRLSEVERRRRPRGI